MKGTEFLKRSRRNHLLKLQALIALDALRGDATRGELSYFRMLNQYDLEYGG
jgi:hypothetical protein